MGCGAPSTVRRLRMDIVGREAELKGMRALLCGSEEAQASEMEAAARGMNELESLRRQDLHRLAEELSAERGQCRDELEEAVEKQQALSHKNWRAEADLHSASMELLGARRTHTEAIAEFGEAVAHNSACYRGEMHGASEELEVAREEFQCAESRAAGLQLRVAALEMQVGTGREECSSLRAECDAIARGSEDVGQQVRAIRAECDSMTIDVSEARERLWLERAERASCESAIEGLREQLDEAADERAAEKKRHLEEEASAKAELTKLRRWFDDTLASRDVALQSCEAVLDSRDEMLNQSRAAVRERDRELAEVRRMSSTMRILVDDSKSQLQAQSEYIARLEDTLAFCSKSTAAQAAAAFLDATQEKGRLLRSGGLRPGMGMFMLTQ